MVVKRRKHTREQLRGATPLVEKQAREFRWPTIAIKIHWVWLLTPVVLIVGFYVAQWMMVRWPITGIEVEGRLSVWAPEKITEKVLWIKEQGFFTADLQAVHDVVADLPLLTNVVIRKKWPGTIVISAYEDVAMAAWNDDKLLSINGNLMAIPEGFNTSNLAKIKSNAEYTDIAVREFRKVQQILSDIGVTVTELAVSNTGSIDIVLSNNWQVAFGRQHFEERVRRLHLLLQNLPNQNVAVIDLRYGKGAAIGWQSMQEKG
jgi:cell division protein FtsQ